MSFLKAESVLRPRLARPPPSPPSPPVPFKLPPSLKRQPEMLLPFLPTFLLFSLSLSQCVLGDQQARELKDERPNRRNHRPLTDDLFDALGAARDERLEGFLDWEKEGGLLKDILIPRTREWTSFMG